MHARHVFHQNLRQLNHRYPLLRRLSLTTSLITLIWFYAIYTGERAAFTSHINACQWENWEKWTADAKPHRLVFIADPQLVDPHTYPGRPWPLSSLTETYTDLYMARNFKLINQRLDPDSIVFMGDLFDGGREWATSRARYLDRDQRDQLIDLGILDASEKEGTRMLSDSSGNKVDLRDYVHGEKGRWKKYGQRQWQSEYTRFGNIFFSAEQLYPHADRELLAAYDVLRDPVSVANGASDVAWQQYAIAGGKQKNVITSLPGNHDLGFGSGVQIAVRDRFEAHFGDTNKVYVIGNHTFVNLDSVSLSAYEELNKEYTDRKRADLMHIWRPADDFLSSLGTSSSKVTAEALNGFYPGTYPTQRYRHEVTEPDAALPHATRKDSLSHPQLPVVLLTHVPLYRPQDTDCGPLRERGHSIPVALGYQYQNVITPSLTTKIAKRVGAAGKLTHVFSGDDHDYCDTTHRFALNRKSESSQKPWVDVASVREVTLKSFSWAMGVRKPAFQLLSLWNPVDAHGNTIGSAEPTIQSHLCLLPDQLGIFINYALLLFVTAAILLVRGVVLTLRKPVSIDPDEEEQWIEQAEEFALPRFTHSRSPSPLPQANGRANGYSSPNKLSTNESKGRQRANSTGTSHGSNSTLNQNLSVQRSYNARTRSVSPGIHSGGSAYGLPTGGPLIDQAGYYPSVRWQDPDEDSDEESHVGSHYDYGDRVDSQAKGVKPRRRKAKGKARIAVMWFVEGIITVAVPAGFFYGWMIRNG